jgi:AsmA protein
VASGRLFVAVAIVVATFIALRGAYRNAMKTGAVIAAASAGLLVLAVALQSWPLSGPTTLRMVRGQFAQAGLTVTSAEGGHVTLLPVPRIDIGHVTVRDQAGDVSLSAAMLRASIRLSSLLTGDIDVTDVTLVQPDVTLSRKLASDLLHRAVGLASPGTDAVPRSATLAAEVQRIVLVDGRVATRDEGGGVKPLAEAFGLVLARSGAGDFDVSAALSLRGEKMQINGSGLRFAIDSRSKAAPLAFEVTSSLLNARLSGRTTGGSNAQTDGDILVKTPSLDRLAAWLDLPPPLALAGPVEIAGTVRLQPTMLSLANARVALDAGHFDGGLTLRVAGDHLALDGTLAAETLDLTRAVAPLMPVPDTDGWSREPYPPDVLPRGDADLRISAGRLTVGKLVLANAALSVLSRAGRVDAILSNGELYNGSMKARLSLGPAPRGIDMRLVGGVERVDLAATLGAIADQRRLGGIATGSIMVEGSGESPQALMRSLEGKASGNLRQGELVGINVSDVLKRLERRPLITSLDVKGGRTSIETGALSARISKGVADISEASLNSSSSRVVLAGQIGLGDRQIALSGAALGPASSGQEQVGLPFDIVGSFDDPQIYPDAKSLIRRSGAAAPFLQPRPAATETGRIDALAPAEPATP